MILILLLIIINSRVYICVSVIVNCKLKNIQFMNNNKIAVKITLSMNAKL